MRATTASRVRRWPPAVGQNDQPDIVGGVPTLFTMLEAPDLCIAMAPGGSCPRMRWLMRVELLPNRLATNALFRARG
jgi:hypothetical protein